MTIVQIVHITLGIMAGQALGHAIAKAVIVWRRR